MTTRKLTREAPDARLTGRDLAELAVVEHAELPGEDRDHVGRIRHVAHSELHSLGEQAAFAPGRSRS